MNPNDVIVDIKISNSGTQDAELLRYGYTQVIPDFSGSRPADFGNIGTFGKGQSMWIWKRSKGTCSGRFKPVVDIQLDQGKENSGMVLSGYVAVPVPVSGQLMWIKRALTDEEEHDAIVDVHVTLGKSNNNSDKIHQSPGVGWNRVAGNFCRPAATSIFGGHVDAFVWFRPARSRAGDSNVQAVMISSAGLNPQVKQSKLLEAVRRAIRHHVPLQKVSDLAKLTMEGEVTNKESKKVDRSDRMFDFTALYHMYETSGKGLMSKGKFTNLLQDVGARMEAVDVNKCFNFFNFKLDGNISREEYCAMLSLTNFERDAIVDKIRAKVLRGEGGKTAVASTKDSADKAKSAGSNNILRDNVFLSKLFKDFNVNQDKILSIDEFLDLTSSLECFLAEDEGRYIMRQMDVDKDDRVEEGDLIAFMQKPSEALFNKAQRVREYSNTFRAWVKNTVGGNFASNSPAMTQLWRTLQTRHEAISQSRFPGYISALDITHLLAKERVRISVHEARELLLLVGPEKHGKITPADLQLFVSRSCRTFGELIAVLERDLLKKVVDEYKKYRQAAKQSGVDNSEARESYEALVKDVVRQVQGAYVVSSDATNNVQDRSRSLQDVVSFHQLKAGVESSMRGFQTPEAQLPNLEEWAALSCLVNAAIAEEDTYGVKIYEFMNGICAYIANGGHTSSTEATVDSRCIELQRMIREEARRYGGGKSNDYRAVFKIFDLDGKGSIDPAEFRSMLQKLRLLESLPESDVPQLMARFVGRSKTGDINYEDFVSFCEKKFSNSATGGLRDDDDIDLATMPASVTKNPDCDELIWTIWREVVKIDARDPEAVVTELQGYCADVASKYADTSSAHCITVKDLWDLLVELNIRGSTPKSQFEKAIKQLVNNGTGAEDDKVDYDELCRYLVKMGRALASKIETKKAADARKFEVLFSSLRRNLVNMVDAAAATTEAPKFERVFARLDADGDGFVSPDEFFQALKRLQISDFEQWTLRMVKRLFDEFDANSDGLLSLKEFFSTLKDGPRPGPSHAKGQLSTLDDDPDDVFSSRPRPSPETAIFKKVSDILFETVPVSNLSDNKTEEVRAAVRKFLAKLDTSKEGVCSEERFAQFCAKSGVRDGLTAGELALLASALRTKGGLVDYDRLVTQVSQGGGRDRAEQVLQRLHEASIDAANSGRAFLSLCSLVDPQRTGLVTREELVHTVKIMGAAISLGEVELLLKEHPEAAKAGRDGSALVDYKELYYCMQYHTPRPSDAAGLMGSATRRGRDSPFSHRPLTLTAPGGLFLRTPADALLERDDFNATSRSSRRRATDRGDGDLDAIFTSVRQAVVQRSRQLGASFSLVRQFEAYDGDRSGMVPLRAFQTVLEDLRVMVTSADLQLISSLFSRRDDSQINYEAFCSAYAATAGGSAAANTAASTGVSSGVAAYLNQRTFQRVKDLRAGGRDPQDMFEAYDLERTGCVDSRKFRDVVNRLQLLQSEYQLTCAMTDFCSLHDKGLVVYEDFCRALDSAEVAINRTSNPEDSAAVGRRKGFVYGSGFDGLRTSRTEVDDTDHALSADNVDRWFKSEASPKQRRDFTNVYESLQRFKGQQEASRTFREFPSDLEDGSELAGPRLSDSLSFGRPPASTRYGAERSSWTRDSWDRDGDTSPKRSYSRSLYPESPSASYSRKDTPLARRSSSPSKVGTAVWGSAVPLAQKGRLPRLEDGRWCCAVCLYVENSHSAKVCGVCDSPNYNSRKDFMVKEQCPNCTFLNGHFSSDCEMCGSRLARREAMM